MLSSAGMPDDCRLSCFSSRGETGPGIRKPSQQLTWTKDHVGDRTKLRRISLSDLLQSAFERGLQLLRATFHSRGRDSNAGRALHPPRRHVTPLAVTLLVSHVRLRLGLDPVVGHGVLDRRESLMHVGRGDTRADKGLRDSRSSLPCLICARANWSVCTPAADRY
jgi:hypothetical protein